MGKMLKEINKILKVQNLKMDTDFCSIKFIDVIVSLDELLEIQKILVKYGYSDYVSIKSYKVSNGVEISFCSKLLHNHFY